VAKQFLTVLGCVLLCCLFFIYENAQQQSMAQEGLQTVD